MGNNLTYQYQSGLVNYGLVIQLIYSVVNSNLHCAINACKKSSVTVRVNIS